MDVVILLVFISLGLVAASLLFFFHRLKEGDFDHAERLALAPLDDGPPAPSTDDGMAVSPPAGAEDSQTDVQPFTPRHGDAVPEEPQGGSSHARC